MSSTVLLWLLALLIFALLWSYRVKGAEVALRAARNACTQANVQLLDQSVSFRRFEWRNRVLKRIYAFEYSPNGRERFRGLLWLVGQRLDYLAFDQASGGYMAASRIHSAEAATTDDGQVPQSASAPAPSQPMLRLVKTIERSTENSSDEAPRS